MNIKSNEDGPTRAIPLLEQRYARRSDILYTCGVADKSILDKLKNEPNFLV